MMMEIETALSPSSHNMSCVDALECEIITVQQEVVFYSNALTTIWEQLSLLVNKTVPPPPEPTITALYPNNPNNPMIPEDECVECGNNPCRHDILMQYNVCCMAGGIPLSAHTTQHTRKTAWSRTLRVVLHAVAKPMKTL